MIFNVFNVNFNNERKLFDILTHELRCSFFYDAICEKNRDFSFSLFTSCNNRREKRISATRVLLFDAPFLDMKSLKYFTFWRCVIASLLLLKLRAK